MTDHPHHPGQTTLAPAGTGLLSSALRRDLADLNALYLDLGLMPGLEGDTRFDWSEAVRHSLLAADPATRTRIAATPFALFDLVLPTALGTASSARVEDSRTVAPLGAWHGRCESFAHQAVFLARRLVEREPLASGVVLGLHQDAQAWLAESRLAQLAEVASNPHVVRPRWRRHVRFWEMLVGAARRGTPTALQWAHCGGLCLLGAADVASAPPPPRRRPRR